MSVENSNKRYHPIRPEDDEDEDHSGGGKVAVVHPRNPAFAAVPVVDDTTAAWSTNNTVGMTAESDDHCDVDDEDEDDDDDENQDLEAVLDGRSIGGGSSKAGGGSRNSSLRITTSASSPLHSGGIGIGIGDHSRSNSFDDDWDDDDDDELGLRRYHLEFPSSASASGNSKKSQSSAKSQRSQRSQQQQQHNTNTHGRLYYRDNVPLPVEFGHSMVSQAALTFSQLRAAARQRRAARLLTMPSERFGYKLHACLLTWCCDATDQGVMLVVFCMTVWLLLGWMVNASSTYWWSGVLVLAVRVSARRAAETLWGLKQRGGSRLRQRRSSIHTTDHENEVMELARSSNSTAVPTLVVEQQQQRPYSDNRLDVDNGSDGNSGAAATTNSNNNKAVLT